MDKASAVRAALANTNPRKQVLRCQHDKPVGSMSAAPNVGRLAGRVRPGFASAADLGVVSGAAETAGNYHRPELVAHHLQLLHERRVHVSTTAAALAGKLVWREVWRCAWVPLAHLPTPFARSNER